MDAIKMDKEKAYVIALIGGIFGTISYILNIYEYRFFGGWISGQFLVSGTTGLEILIDDPLINLNWFIVLLGLIGSIIVILSAFFALSDLKESLTLISNGFTLQVIAIIGMFISEFNADFDYLLEYIGPGYFILLIGTILSIIGIYSASSAE